MIFGFWIGIWIILAKLPLLLVVPLLALVIRANYMDRRIINLAKIVPVIVATGLFLVNNGDEKMTTMEALMFSLKIVVSSWVFLHLLEGIKNHSFARSHARIQKFIFTFQRAWAVGKVRTLDIVYNFRVRVSHPKVSFILRCRLVCFFLILFFTELLTLTKRFEISLNARGVWPGVSLWVVPPRRNIAPFIGDVVLATLAILPASVLSARDWIPGQIVETIRGIL